MNDPLADRLAALRPDTGCLSRDRLLFEAGRRSVRPGRFWPCASVVLGVTCVLLLLWPTPTPPVPPTPAPVIVVVPAGPAPASTGEFDPDSVRAAVRLRNAVIEHGPDALPPAPMTGPPLVSRDELFSFLGGTP